MERLNQIYDIQKQLDDTIFKKYSLTDKESVKNKKILGFIVETSELANATKSYKYWSRTLPNTKEELLEDYSDGLHFLLSLCLELEVDLTEKFEPIEKIEDLCDLFHIIIKEAIELRDDFTKEKGKKLLSYYIYLGEKLGFKIGYILEGYIKKNKSIIEKHAFEN
jgi:dimeric dUTPase (all-alpha-NTP-PPase superfamily)